MRRRALLIGGLSLAACRRAPTDIPVAVGATPKANANGGDDATPVGDEPSEQFAALAGFCDGVAGPDESEYAAHVAKMQGELARVGAAAFVAEAGPTMTWLSGTRWGKSERPFLIVVPDAGAPWVLCPAFEEGTAREQLSDTELVPWQEHESPYAVLAARLGKAAAKRKVALDGELRGFIGDGLRGAIKAGVLDGQPIVDACRMHKSDAELARLRRANEATKAALKLVAPQVEPGMRSADISALVQQAQTAAGLDSIWVLALVGPAAAFPHGTADDPAVADGDLVLVDTGGGLHGYRSDISRTFAVGQPSEEARRAWQTVLDAQSAALALMKPGVRCGDVDAAARKVIADAGYGEGYTALSHRLGHGIGLQVHEEPYLRPQNDRVLAPGMTMSNEPGIYRRGELGIRLEDIVAITDTGHEVFGPRGTSVDDPFGA